MTDHWTRERGEVMATCETCRFWDAELMRDAEFAPCRRYPPLVVHGQFGVIHRWPDTNENSWCGEYQPRPTQGRHVMSDVPDEFGEALEHKARVLGDKPVTWYALFELFQKAVLEATPPHRTAADAAMPEGAMEAVEMYAACEDCGRQYGNEYGFPDLIIPLDVWCRISTNGDDSGLLCPSCICARLCKAGITCEGAFMSGPIETVSRPTMYALRRVENLEIRARSGTGS